MTRRTSFKTPDRTQARGSHTFSGSEKAIRIQGHEMTRLVVALVSTMSTALGSSPTAAQAPLGVFEEHRDVGIVLHAGSAEYDASRKSYTLTGSGENMWSTRDAFHFAWMKASGDLVLESDVVFIGQGKAPHRKACLIIRQDLDADSAYVDVALHGDGLTSLQFREDKGGTTHEVQANVTSPRRLRIEK